MAEGVNIMLQREVELALAMQRALDYQEEYLGDTTKVKGVVGLMLCVDATIAVYTMTKNSSGWYVEEGMRCKSKILLTFLQLSVRRLT